MLALLGLGGVALCFLAEGCGGGIARRWPNALVAAGAGKVPDGAAFAAARLKELGLLWAGGVAMVCGVAWLLRGALRGQRESLPRVLAVAAAVVVVANGGAWLAGRSALFWLGLQVRGHENQAAFRAKERLLGEIRGVPRFAVVGSSQANTQFHEELFNEALGGKAWMVDLHFPGSTAADVYFVTERLGPGEVEGVIYYTSPLSFVGREMTTARDLLRLRDLPEMYRLGVWKALSPIVARYTALGVALPLFQYRSPWINATIGTHLPPRPGHQPKDERRRLEAGDLSPWQQRAFERMLERVAAKGQRLIVIEGQYHPDIEARNDPAYRKRYEAYLREVCARWPNVVYLRQEEILAHSAADYADSSHVTREAGERFTRRFVEKWKERRW